jgi:tetratricopeptide (TPR) repeat protein
LTVSGLKKLYLAIALLWIGTGTVFFGVTKLDFVAWDDDVLIYENPYLHPPTIPHLQYFWKRPHQLLYIPLTYSTWSGLSLAAREAPRVTADGFVSTLSARPFHLFNLLLHLLNVTLVFLILRLVISHKVAACAGTTIFALHPVQVESVAWASEMKGLLGAFFSLISLYYYLLHTQQDLAILNRKAALGPQPSPPRRKRSYLFVASIAFLLALLSKPSAVIVPLLAAFFDLWTMRRGWRIVFLTLAPWLLVSLCWVWLTSKMQPVDSHVTQAMAPWWTRFLIAGDALYFYARHFLIPTPLGIDYGRTPDKVLQTPQQAFIGLFIVTLWFTLLGFFYWPQKLLRHEKEKTNSNFFSRHQTVFALAPGLWMAALLPVLGLFPFAFQSISTVADRYLYLALLGPSLCYAYFFERTLHTTLRPFILGVTLLMIVVLGYNSMRQIHVWRDSTTLYQNAIAVNPLSSLALTNLAIVKARQGQRQESLKLLQKALHTNPGYPDAHYALGYDFLNQQQLKQAQRQFERVITLRPAHEQAHYHLGVLLARQGKNSEAQQHFTAAIQAKPDFAEAHNNLGMALARQSRLTQAIAHWQISLQLRPNYPSAHYNLGLARLNQGLQEEAVEHFQNALRHGEYPPARRALEAINRPQ